MVMLRTLLAIVVVVGYVSGSGYNELLQKFGQKKIFESCFGKEVMEKKFKEFYGYVEQCKNDSMAGQVTKKSFNWRAALSSIGSEEGPIYLPIPIITQGRNSPFFFGGNRQKRAAFFSEEKLRMLKENVLEKLRIATCVLQKMEIFDMDMNMQWDMFEKQYYKGYELDTKLKEDMSEVFSKCKNLVMCIPMVQKPGSYPISLKQMMFFKKCEMEKKTAACIKKDLRDRPEMFELQGLDGMLDHYEDEDDKMLMVLKMYHKYGNDDAAFFH